MTFFNDKPYIPMFDPYQAAAWYLAWLAYPRRWQGKQRETFVFAVMASIWPREERTTTTGLREIRLDRINGTIRRAFNIIFDHRLPAAWVLSRMLNGCSQSRAFEEWTRNSGVDIDGWKKRTWRPSRPTLAMASPIFLLVFSKKRKLDHLLRYPNWMNWAIDGARNTAPEIETLLKRSIKRGSLLVPDRTQAKPPRPKIRRQRFTPRVAPANENMSP